MLTRTESYTIIVQFWTPFAWLNHAVWGRATRNGQVSLSNFSYWSIITIRKLGLESAIIRDSTGTENDCSRLSRKSLDFHKRQKLDGDQNFTDRLNETLVRSARWRSTLLGYFSQEVHAFLYRASYLRYFSGKYFLFSAYFDVTDDLIRADQDAQVQKNSAVQARVFTFLLNSVIFRLIWYDASHICN